MKYKLNDVVYWELRGETLKGRILGCEEKAQYNYIGYIIKVLEVREKGVVTWSDNPKAQFNQQVREEEIISIEETMEQKQKTELIKKALEVRKSLKLYGKDFKEINNLIPLTKELLRLIIK